MYRCFHSIAIDCGEPVIRSNVQTNFSIETSNTGYGSAIEFVCDEGYSKNGKYWGTYECSDDHQWGLTDTKHYGDIICNGKPYNILYLYCTWYKGLCVNF